MKYCCHVWVDAPKRYLNLHEILQKRVCKAVGPSIANSSETLAHWHDAVILRLFLSFKANKIRLIQQLQFSIKPSYI